MEKSKFKIDITIEGCTPYLQERHTARLTAHFKKQGFSVSTKTRDKKTFLEVRD